MREIIDLKTSNYHGIWICGELRNIAWLSILGIRFGLGNLGQFETRYSVE
jgi:hypothetical protein